MPNWWGLSFVFRCLDDGGGEALSRQWLPCTGCWRYSHDMNYLLYGILFLQISASLRCFCQRTLFPKTVWTGWHGHPLYQIYLINQDTRQECFRLSNRSFLWCCWPWVDHLPPVRWSTFSFMFVNGSWCENLIFYPRVWPSIVTL